MKTLLLTILSLPLLAQKPDCAIFDGDGRFTHFERSDTTKAPPAKRVCFDPRTNSAILSAGQERMQWRQSGSDILDEKGVKVVISPDSDDAAFVKAIDAEIDALDELTKTNTGTLTAAQVRRFSRSMRVLLKDLRERKLQ